MAENTWPLKNKLPEGYQFFTKADLLEFLSIRPDGVHIA